MADRNPLASEALFNALTRQNSNIIKTMQFSENDKDTQWLPKARYLQKICLLVEGTFDLTHAAKTTYTAKTGSMYHLLQNISLSLQSSYKPYDTNGFMLYLKTLIERNYFLDSLNITDYLTNVVSPTGATNTVRFILELPVAINENSTQGFINLQHQENWSELELTFGAITDIMTDTDITASNINISVTPQTFTFSQPNTKDAVPQFDFIRLCQSQKELIPSSGEHLKRLQTNTTYRKIIAYLRSDNAYTPIPVTSLNEFQLRWNTNDIPITLNPKILRYSNMATYGKSLPDGVYVFDFTNMGLSNYGTRDLVNTRGLTEFELKIVTNSGLVGSTNYLELITDQLVNLK